ncbi:hypothetical protein [Emticicia sp. BO119]|uniref:hypothetical protein n=1 Tax=Emticicia sp. BO119 TaxID=2757768 RepID=UPI0015F11784|nr:hypothetical protein [Emticicia sp. BO119]MBA4849025.1 hypothetical protein [Emticicia sp. BO119]
MKKLTLMNIFFVIVGVIGAVFGIRYLLGRNTKTNNTTTPAPIPTTGGSGGGGGGSAPLNLPNFTFKDAYSNTNIAYASAQDALNRNQAGSGFTNRDATFYASSIANGQGLFLNATGTVKAAPGYYYYPTTGKAIIVDVTGVLTIVNGTPTSLPVFTFKDAYGGSNTPYASAQDALDRNQAGSGLTHRNATFYASSIANGQVLYTNSLGMLKAAPGFYFYPTTGKAITVDASSVITIYNGTATALPSFIIKDAYGGSNTPYASLNDALDKNLEGSGFTNRNASIYASAMNNGVKAYTSALGLTTFPAGNYFYDTNFEMLSIDVNGVMTFSSDVTKSGLNSQNITDSYNS